MEEGYWRDDEQKKEKSLLFKYNMLPKENRLTKKKAFDQLLKKGQAYFSQTLILKIIKNNLYISRFGFIISKKIAKKAVIRNKLKRRLREIIRKDISQLKGGYDIVIIAKKNSGVADKNYQLLKEEVKFLEKKAGLLKK